MIDTKSVIVFFTCTAFSTKLIQSEKTFQNLITWSKETTQNAVYLRKWRNLKIEDFKTKSKSSKSAMYELHERANTLQDMLDYAHKHQTLFIEVLENSLQD